MWRVRGKARNRNHGSWNPRPVFSPQDSCWSPGKKVKYTETVLSLILWQLVLAMAEAWRLGLPQHTGPSVQGLKSPQGGTLVVAEAGNFLPCVLRGRVGLGVVCLQHSSSSAGPLTAAGQIPLPTLPPPGTPETALGVGRAVGQPPRWQVGTLELSVPEQS